MATTLTPTAQEARAQTPQPLPTTGEHGVEQVGQTDRFERSAPRQSEYMSATNTTAQESNETRPIQ
jgi:hypothetical protein